MPLACGFLALASCLRDYVYNSNTNARIFDAIFPTPDSRLPTSYSRLPTPDSRLPTPDSLLPLLL
ncbi:MAG: hypothetical protein F6K53_18040 [Moorea sp. SIO4A1]|uniref:hypothetical protein n=1 Tax=Moorena sp. SIO4A1 TaxID=2607835 RepID=UPI00145042CE|nr:hypothetical protein [Moorena sp. SIO4A1]NEQ59182.1 hypothetical protein [Moorena sp. SIO4A1]